MIEKIAIIKLSAIGDIIHCMVVLQYIKKAFPNVKIDWIVESALSGILKDNPDINNILTVNLKEIKKNRWKLFNQIKLILGYSSNNYDLVIDAQGLLKSSIVAKLLKSKVVGFDKDSIREKIATLFYDKKVSIAYDQNIIDRNIKIFSSSLNFIVSTEDILNKNPFLFYLNEDNIIYDYLSKDKKNILFVIGASLDSKIFSKEKFIRIIEAIEGNCLILWGSEKEKDIANFIASLSNAKILPKMDLNSLKALISKVDLVIGNDTGPTHMAWALNIPSITLFGNTPGYRNSYKTIVNKIIESDTEVNPHKLNKNDFSIRNIDEKKIIALAKDLLRE